ncbi:hypothetical protein ABIA14_004425 [Sinorhizobium fredii]|uniref:hypothetical protein n=1 Tax=Rhizobium fredii TaxID=380 RepID=UPI003515CF10
MTLTKEQRVGEIVALRTKLKVNPDIRKELNDAMTAVLSKNGIRYDAELSPELIFALPEEVADALSDVILPGGTNC